MFFISMLLRLIFSLSPCFRHAGCCHAAIADAAITWLPLLMLMLPPFFFHCRHYHAVAAVRYYFRLPDAATLLRWWCFHYDFSLLLLFAFDTPCRFRHCFSFHATLFRWYYYCFFAAIDYAAIIPSPPPPRRTAEAIAAFASFSPPCHYVTPLLHSCFFSWAPCWCCRYATPCCCLMPLSSRLSAIMLLFRWYYFHYYDADVFFRCCHTSYMLICRVIFAITISHIFRFLSYVCFQAFAIIAYFLSFYTLIFTCHFADTIDIWYWYTPFHYCWCHFRFRSCWYAYYATPARHYAMLHALLLHITLMPFAILFSPLMLCCRQLRCRHERDRYCRCYATPCHCCRHCCCRSPLITALFAIICCWCCFTLFISLPPCFSPWYDAAIHYCWDAAILPPLCCHRCHFRHADAFHYIIWYAAVFVAAAMILIAAAISILCFRH